jgi:hypothetical protein
MTSGMRHDHHDATGAHTVTDHFQETLALLDAAEQRHRDEARRTAQADREPVTREHQQEQFAEELATRLKDSQSPWVTFTSDGNQR